MNWLTNLEQAKEESLKSHKLILLQFEMENCGGCKKMNATTYKDQKVIDEMNEWFVLLKQDLIKDREIRKLLGAYWTPLFIFLIRMVIRFTILMVICQLMSSGQC